MNPSLRLLKFIFGILILIVLALFLPSAASAWFLNSANANLVRAVALPDDAPSRAVLLAQSSAQLAQARSLSSNSRIDLAVARGWIENTQLQHAMNVFDSSGDAWRGDFMAQFIWGNVEYALGNQLSAFAHWREAGASEYFMQATLRHLLRDEWHSAEASARIAIGITPDVPLAHYFLGDALSHQSGNYAEAISELKRAQELLGPRDHELLSQIFSRQGEIFAAQGKTDQAILYFDQARQIAPLDARPRTDYARLIVKTDPSAAEKLLTQVIADSPWYIDAYVLLADLAESRGDQVGAEKWYQTGLSKNPNDARLNYPLGQFYARHKKTSEARAALNSALKSETRADVLLAIAAALNQVDQK